MDESLWQNYPNLLPSWFKPVSIYCWLLVECAAKLKPESGKFKPGRRKIQTSEIDFVTCSCQGKKHQYIASWTSGEKPKLKPEEHHGVDARLLVWIWKIQTRPAFFGQMQESISSPARVKEQSISTLLVEQAAKNRSSNLKSIMAWTRVLVWLRKFQAAFRFWTRRCSGV